MAFVRWLIAAATVMVATRDCWLLGKVSCERYLVLWLKLVVSRLTPEILMG
jgi:hypothetical protein